MIVKLIKKKYCRDVSSQSAKASGGWQILSAGTPFSSSTLVSPSLIFNDPLSEDWRLWQGMPNPQQLKEYPLECSEEKFSE